MTMLLIDPYRQTIETVPMTGPRQADPAHPAAARVNQILHAQGLDRQFLPDGDVLTYTHDEILTPTPIGAMVQDRLVYGYALVVPSGYRTTLATDAETVSEDTFWLTTPEQFNAAVRHIHF